MKKKVSLKDIAKEIGVSTALVSYVLNNKFKDRINKDLAAKIRQTAKDLNYQPNQIARSLKTDKTFTIGLIIADIANPFSAHIARIIEDCAKKAEYSVIFGSSDENIEKTQDLIDLFLYRQVDGLIVALPEHAEAQVEYLKSKQIPFVLIDRYYPQTACNSVSIDNYAAAQKAIDHLHQKGHERIGIIGYDTTLYHLNERTRGAKDLLKENLLIGKVRIDHVDEDIKTAIDIFMSNPNPPTALFFTTNLLTISGLKHINNMGMKVPDQLAIVGFDETDAFDLFYVSITYVKQPMLRLGQKSVELLIKAINDNEIVESIEFDTELIVNKSSG